MVICVSELNQNERLLRGSKTKHTNEVLIKRYQNCWHKSQSDAHNSLPLCALGKGFKKQ